MPTLNTSTSVVDYLKSVGLNSNIANRSTLASQAGISGYTGSSDQNISLLNYLKTNKVGTQLTQNTNATDRQDQMNSVALDKAMANLGQSQINNPNFVQGNLNGINSSQFNQINTAVNQGKGASASGVVGGQSQFQNTNNQGGNANAGGAGVDDRKNNALNLYNSGVTDITKLTEKLNYDQAGNKIGDYTIGEVSNLVKESPNYKPSTSDYFTEQQRKLYAEIESQSKSYLSTLDGIRQRADLTNQSLIDGIKKTFEARRQKMMDINDRYLGTKKEIGYESGLSRYAGQVQQGILTDEELKGEQRLAELDAQEIQLIAQAEKARSDSDYEMLNDKMSYLAKVNKEKQDLLDGMYKASLDERKRLDDMEKQAKEREKEDFEKAGKILEGSGTALYEEYSKLSSDQERDKYLATLSSQLKLPVAYIKSQLDEAKMKSDKASLGNQEILSRIEENKSQTNKNNRGGRGGSGTGDMDTDVNDAVSNLVSVVKSKGWSGIDPTLYEEVVAYLQKTYGYKAVQKLNTAINANGLTVDKVGDGKGYN